ncbi:MAG: hypothetical protein FWG01_03770 [Betaproteobacteria bacterium]|nr:hypothetical protein [Betaproteobacteria bacterium]
MTQEQLQSFFGWGAICNIVLLSVIFFIYLATRELIYRLHGRWFDGMKKETLNTLIYGAMAYYKITIYAFFIVPYIVLRFFV